MAEKTSSPQQDLFFFLSLLAGLFILWAATGGPNGEGGENPFFSGGARGELRDAENISLAGGDALTREQLEEEIIDVQKELVRLQEELVQARIQGTASPYEDTVSLSRGRAQERFAQTEYVELAASSGNAADIPITGWMLESVVTGERAVIGEAAGLPFPGTVNQKSTIFLAPGERAFVVTGRSPIGVSFRVNQCVGYFEQFQNFSPRLRRECPDPVVEFDRFAAIPVTHVRLEDDEREICRAFIDRNINRCEINREDLTERELRLSEACQAFIEETYTYSGCVENHRFDSDFFKSEWRVFLGGTAELWREEREIIRLLDEEGRTVDIIDY